LPGSVFVDGLAVRALVLGDDFRFGRAREGDAASCGPSASARVFVTQGTRTVLVDGERVSSTRLRSALAAGDFVLAERLLGRPFTLGGRVMHGRRLGRELGAPTANVGLRRRSVPLSGVFAVRVTAPACGRAGHRQRRHAAHGPRGSGRTSRCTSSTATTICTAGA
jgi:riboflavin kinase/FMN adenylyltransferase